MTFRSIGKLAIAAAFLMGTGLLLLGQAQAVGKKHEALDQTKTSIDAQRYVPRD